MAHFYGTIRGQRGEVSRLGTKSSGLRTYAASWAGAVVVQLWHDEKTGQDMAEVSLTRHRGAGVERVIFHGPIDGSMVILPPGALTIARKDGAA